MTLSRTLFGCGRTDWETPPALFRLLDREFTFTLDVCASAANHKCRVYFTRQQDALRQRWSGRCWMNPPYGNAISAWTRKALEESGRGATVVSLLPARTDTAWWHDHVMKAREIRLLRGRLTFVGATSPAPFPSAIVIFKPNTLLSGVPRVAAWHWRRPLTPHPASYRAAASPTVAA